MQHSILIAQCSLQSCTALPLQEERRAGNPVAGLIDSLQLERSRVTLLLRQGLIPQGTAQAARSRC